MGAQRSSGSGIVFQGAMMAVLGMAGWGLVFLALPNSSTTLFAPSSVTNSRPSVAVGRIPQSGLATTLRSANNFDVPSEVPLSGPVKTRAAAAAAIGEAVLTLSPIVLAMAGMWALVQRFTRPQAPQFAFAAAAASGTSATAEKSFGIDMPTLMAANTMVDTSSVVDAAPAVRQPAARDPKLDAWTPENVIPEGKDYAELSKQHVIIVGVSVHSTPVEIREKLAVPKERWPNAIDELVAYYNVQEAAVLSTCNRMEVYAVGPDYTNAVRDIITWMTAHSGISFEELRPYLFLKQDGVAVDHVLQVSAGLDSLIVGEGQILAQVKSVHQIGSESKGFGQYLAAMFMQAITAGKRVRSETSIATGAVSVSSAAAELAQLKLPNNNWDGVNVAIIGAGKMSKLLVKHLVSKNCLNMTIVNRSLPRAQELQEEFPQANIKVELSDKLMDVVAASDVIFAASSSTEILVQASDVVNMPPPPALVGGVRRFFDISVPRNTGRDLNDIPTARVFNVDDLKEVVEMNKEARAQAAAEALVLLQEEKAAFEGWMASLQAVPTIKRLRGKAENIRLMELEKAKSKLGDELSAKQLKVLEDLSRGIMNKMLHAPMQALRSEGDVQTHIQTIHTLGRVFGLSEEDEKPRVGK